MARNILPGPTRQITAQWLFNIVDLLWKHVARNAVKNVIDLIQQQYHTLIISLKEDFTQRLSIFRRELLTQKVIWVWSPPELRVISGTSGSSRPVLYWFLLADWLPGYREVSWLLRTHRAILPKTTCCSNDATTHFPHSTINNGLPKVQNPTLPTQNTLRHLSWSTASLSCSSGSTRETNTLRRCHAVVVLAVPALAQLINALVVHAEYVEISFLFPSISSTWMPCSQWIDC